MSLRWLNAQEWLEHERLTGLPHADFAHEALAAMEGLAQHEEADQQLLNLIHDLTGDTISTSDQIVECFEFRDRVMQVLVDAGVSDGDILTGDQASGLLRMFLPAE